MEGDSLEAIHRDFLRGHELTLQAYNRLVAIRAPVVPVAMHVVAELIEEGADAAADRTRP